MLEWRGERGDQPLFKALKWILVHTEYFRISPFAIGLASFSETNGTVLNSTVLLDRKVTVCAC